LGLAEDILETRATGIVAAVADDDQDPAFATLPHDVVEPRQDRVIERAPYVRGR